MAERPSDLFDPVVIGVISAPHGVRGTLRVKPVGDGRHLRSGVSPLMGEARREIVECRSTPKGFLVDFEGFTDRSEVEALRGTDLILDRSELDPPEDDEVYVADLVGLEAFDEEGERLGIVAETFPTAAHEVLLIRGDSEGSPEVYIPFTTEHVPGVDLEAGSISVNPPEPDEEG